MQIAKCIWDMGQLPFHVGALPQPRDDHFPSRLPFRVGYDAALGLVRQVHDAATEKVLSEVYGRGSQLGIPMAGHGLGKAYAGDFLDTIAAWSEGGVEGDHVLEIGCGTGHLLGALAEAGARVAGIEPDPRCKEAMAGRGIPVATCAFEDFDAAQTWDRIVHYCVLEHVVDPVAFLRRQRDLLSRQGRIICAVPDCGPAFEDGDISIFIHQHWSYFAAASLRRVAAAAGLDVAAEAHARVGGLLYVSLMRATERASEPPAEPPAEARAAQQADADAFVQRARAALQRLHAYVHQTRTEGRTLGIYCPVRAINYAPDGDEAWLSARLFDDAPQLLGRFVPPFVEPVEGGGGLEREGVDELLIMSRAFGPAIEAAVRERHPQPEPSIRHIGDLLA